MLESVSILARLTSELQAIIEVQATSAGEVEQKAATLLSWKDVRLIICTRDVSKRR